LLLIIVPIKAMEIIKNTKHIDLEKSVSARTLIVAALFEKSDENAFAGAVNGIKYLPNVIIGLDRHLDTLKIANHVYEIYRAIRQ
jgi:hypothetical protein